MFWGRYGKKQLRGAYHAELPQTIFRLEKMGMSSLSQVYCAMATEDRKLVQGGGRAIGMIMKHMTMRQVIRLSERFRQYTLMGWSIDWKKLDIRGKRDRYRLDRDCFWVLALGSFHSKNYYRQVCLEETAGYLNAFPFLVLRFNDWVGQMRLVTVRAVLTYLEIYPLDELFMTMVALDKVRRSGRKDDQAADTLPVFHGND